MGQKIVGRKMYGSEIFVAHKLVQNICFDYIKQDAGTQLVPAASTNIVKTPT